MAVLRLTRRRRASSRGRIGVGWFLLSAIISPLLGLILVLVLPNLKSERLQRIRHAELMRALGGAASEETQSAFERGLTAKAPSDGAGFGTAAAIVAGMVAVFFIGWLVFGPPASSSPPSSSVSSTAERDVPQAQHTPETEAFARAIRKRDRDARP